MTIDAYIQSKAYERVRDTEYVERILNTTYHRWRCLGGADPLLMPYGSRMDEVIGIFSWHGTMIAGGSSH